MWGVVETQVATSSPLFLLFFRSISMLYFNYFSLCLATSFFFFLSFHPANILLPSISFSYKVCVISCKLVYINCTRYLVTLPRIILHITDTIPVATLPQLPHTPTHSFPSWPSLSQSSVHALVLSLYPPPPTISTNVLSCNTLQFSLTWKMNRLPTNNFSDSWYRECNPRQAISIIFVLHFRPNEKRTCPVSYASLLHTCYITSNTLLLSCISHTFLA